MTSGRRHIWHAALLCVPALVIIVVAGIFLRKEIPHRIALEQIEYEAQCAAMATDWASGLTGSEGLDYLGSVPSMWIEAGNKVRGWKGKVGDFVWGYFARGDEQEFVWCETREMFYGKFVEAFRPSSFIYWLCALAGLMTVAVIILTIMVVRLFVFSDKMRIDFMNAIAHDLRTPLVGMRLLVGTDDEAVRNLVERLLRIVENFRDFAGMATRKKPVCTVFDLRRVYDEAYLLYLEDYRDSFDGEDVDVTLEASADASYEVWADEMMTSQIIWNLLGNDLKYAAPYGRVHASFGVDDSFVTLRLADEGPGMTAREMRRAFDRYYRARTVQTALKCGYGIGLATGRTLARQMGGDLTVRAASPHGCIFELRLPKRGTSSESASSKPV